MTVIHYGDQRYTGLSGDTKPTTVAGAEFTETDTQKRFRSDGTNWIPFHFTTLSQYKVTNVGSTTYVIDQNSRVAASNTDTQIAVQAVLDAMVVDSTVEFYWDSTSFAMNNPILIPSSTNNDPKFVRMYGLWAPSGTAGMGTLLDVSATFPTNRYIFEGSNANGTVTVPLLTIDGINATNGNFLTRNVGYAKIEADTTTPKESVVLSNIWMRYMWRGIHLIGGIWSGKFYNIAFFDANASFVGEADIITEYGGHTGSGNQNPKYNYFQRMMGNKQGEYDAVLKMKSGSYNTFDLWNQDGGKYKTAPFMLDNSDPDPHLVTANSFQKLQTLDVVAAPTPDNREGFIYLNGAGVVDNVFRVCRGNAYPNTVRISGGAQRNNIEVLAWWGNSAVLNDTGAGEDNTIMLTQGNKATAGTNTVTHTGGLSRIIDTRKGAEKSGFTSVADGGTIAHGLFTTPLWIQVTPSVAGELASVTTKTTTTFTVALKTHAGAAGTTQSVYWRAGVWP